MVYLVIGLSIFHSTHLILITADKYKFRGHEYGDLVYLILGEPIATVVKGFILFASIACFIAAVLLSCKIISGIHVLCVLSIEPRNIVFSKTVFRDDCL